MVCKVNARKLFSKLGEACLPLYWRELPAELARATSSLREAMIKVCAVKSKRRSAISWPSGTERLPSVSLAQARSEVSSVVPGVPAAKPSWANEAMPLSLRACTTSSTRPTCCARLSNSDLLSSKLMATMK